jgi:hypothetical protein
MEATVPFIFRCAAALSMIAAIYLSIDTDSLVIVLAIQALVFQNAAEYK